MNLVSDKMVTFECKLCKEMQKFNPNDPHTYVQESESEYSTENFFNMKLRRFKVKHITKDNKEHYNIVIVDQNNDYRGHKDYYEKIVISNEYQIEDLRLVQHSKIEFLVVIDFLNKQVLEFVNTSQLKTTNLITKMDEFYKNNQEMYEQLPDELVFEIIHKKFYLLKKSENVFIIVTVNDSNLYPKIKTIISCYNETELSKNSITNTLYTIILQIIDKTDIQDNYEKIISFTTWLFNNSIFTVPLVIDKKILVDIPAVLSKLSDELSCSKSDDFMKIFTGNVTVSQYIQKYPIDYHCVKRIMEMMDNRKVITQA